MKETKIKRCISLFYMNLFISTFTFGGGYVVVPMIRKYFVQKKKLFDEEELMDMAAVAQSTPGAIAVNLSAISGYRTAGVAGAIVSCIAAVLPPLVILSVISVFYAEFSRNRVVAAVLLGMQAGAAALIVDLTVDMCMMIIRKKSWLLTMMVPAAFVANFLLHVNVAVILLSGCVVCTLWLYWNKRRKGGNGDDMEAPGGVF